MVPFEPEYRSSFSFCYNAHEWQDGFGICTEVFKPHIESCRVEIQVRHTRNDAHCKGIAENIFPSVNIAGNAEVIVTGEDVNRCGNGNFAAFAVYGEHIAFPLGFSIENRLYGKICRSAALHLWHHGHGLVRDEAFHGIVGHRRDSLRLHRVLPHAGGKEHSGKGSRYKYAFAFHNHLCYSR